MPHRTNKSWHDDAATRPHRHIHRRPTPENPQQLHRRATPENPQQLHRRATPEDPQQPRFAYARVCRYITQVMNHRTKGGAGLLREMAGLEEGAPLFVQVAERLADEIADGGLVEGEQVPSTNELAAYYRINPATAAKGINMLTDEGLLEKRRGIGMFVAAGARARLLAERRKRFAERYVEPLVAEAGRLGIDADDLIALIREGSTKL
jgi:GntR family transcriptional regulator